MAQAGQAERSGPLAGLSVLEMAGIGPVPLAGLILAEMGARLVRIERPDNVNLIPIPAEFDLDLHGREVLTVDLKRQEGRDLLMRLVERSDVLLEGYRPGVMERLGAGPEEALRANPRLVYGRMTGFGQEGPLAGRAGHDLTYLAYCGVLHAIGPKGGKPVVPLNLAADYGGGSMFLVAGVLAALLERVGSGKGQVVDAAMVDGASMLASRFFASLSGGLWRDERGANLIDGGAPFYDTYATADGRHMAVACLEPQFFAEFARLLPLEVRFVAAQHDNSLWDEMRMAIAARMREKTREEWTALFEGTDACVAPVLSLGEAPDHAHAKARRSHVVHGVLSRPAPAPRLSRTPARPARLEERSAERTLAGFGLEGGEVRSLIERRVVE
ncbi:MAG: CaiB/BaiF CoA transferase family protein [Rhizobiaceae bacterium]